MKIAELYTIPSGHPPGYLWMWRTADGSATSSGSFALYYDCLCDARNQGYAVELTHAAGNTAPGGAGYRLRSQQDGDQS